MSKHTPTPWRLWSDAEGSFIIYGPGDIDSAPVLATRNGWTHNAAESRANGRLMAAAPEILAAAQRLLSAWDDWFRESLTTGELSMDGCRRCDKAAEALRAECLKAGGPS